MEAPLLWFLLLLACPVVTTDYTDRIRDKDADGFNGVSFGGVDCDDGDPLVNPLAEEVWYDGIDQDCDGNDDDQDGDGYAVNEDCDDQDASVGDSLSWFVDADGDGYGAASVDGGCEPTAEQARQSGDCDDHDGDAFPGAVWYVDRDDDGYGDPDTAIASCDRLPGRIPQGGDCDDYDHDVHPGAYDDPVDFQDRDCAGDTDVDQDGDGLPDPPPTWVPEWPDSASCPPTPSRRHVDRSGSGDHPTIQDAIEHAAPCDTIVVHDGVYEDFVVPKELYGVVIAAAPDASPRIVAGVAAEASAIVEAEGTLLYGLTFEGGPVGVLGRAFMVLDHIGFEDVLLPVKTQSEAMIVASRFERGTLGVDSSGNTLAIHDSDFIDITSVGGVIHASASMGDPTKGLQGTSEGVVIDQVTLQDLRFDRCTGGIRPIVDVDAANLEINKVVWQDPSSSVLHARVRKINAHRLTVDGGVSFSDHLIHLENRDPPGGEATLDQLTAIGHIWSPIADPGFVRVDDFDTTTVSHVVLRGNILRSGFQQDSEDLQVPFVPVWLWVRSTAATSDLEHTLHNIEVSVGEELTNQGQPKGVGIATQAGTLEQITVVGLDAAVWPLLGQNKSGNRGPKPPQIRNVIAWDNDQLYRLSALDSFVAKAPSGELIDALVCNNGDDLCIDEDPMFLRYSPAMPAETWDLRLQPTSPYYRYDAPPEEASPCFNDPFAVEFQLGAFGNRSDFKDPPTPYWYWDCDADGLYDTWEWEFLALIPNEDDDGDGLSNLKEFKRGTYPTLPDTDSDTVSDDADDHPLDPNAQ